LNQVKKERDRFGLVGNTVASTFRVDRVVAEGGFGVVYKAYHLHFRSPVALKCLKIPGELSAEDRQVFLEQFRSEAEIQFRLSSQLPHIVRPLHVDAVQTKDGVFVPLMALEWLEGQTFESLIENRAFAGEAPMSLSEAMRLIGPAAEALHRAHNFEVEGEPLSVVHRDVKPDNLFLTEVAGEPVVKLLDFGISKVRRSASKLAGKFSKTDGKSPFSPAYGAPEQWVPKRLGQTGPWTDVWGLALTLVEIIKGDVVVTGDHQAMMGTVLDPRVRPSPRSEGVTVSDEVESVFLKALSLDPRYRYQTIRSFWESLQAANESTGDLTLGFRETPSGSRIALPVMRPPIPWGSLEMILPDTDAPSEHLPPMLAPAMVRRTDLSDLPVDSATSYPIDPGSGLMPVLAAPTSWEHFDPEVPPSSTSSQPSFPEQSNQSSPVETSECRLLAGERLAPDPPNWTNRVELELQATSSYPAPICSEEETTQGHLSLIPMPGRRSGS
jgi:serine/threonine protein kinase